MKREEDSLQIATAEWVRLRIHPSVIAHHSANERKGAAAGAKAKAMGQLAGWPDWVFIWFEGGFGSGWGEAHTFVAFIELKSKTGRISPEQKSFKEKAKLTGTDWTVCRNLDEFADCVKQWGIPLRNYN